MTKYLKQCPKCKKQNEEFENICRYCECFIGMEVPIPMVADSQTQIQQSAKDPLNKLYLELAGNMYAVENGWELGQAHQTSKAQIQIRGQNGSEYLHRNHCRFNQIEGVWMVTSIDQKSLGREFTNPTTVNQKLLEPGMQTEIKHGDEITMAGLSFTVRLVD